MQLLSTVFQGVNMVEVLIVMILVAWLVAKGVLVPSAQHQETIKFMQQVIDDQRQQIARLEARLAAIEDYRAPHDD